MRITGATIHKGLLRIVGCIIGGSLGLFCSIWLYPRYDTFGAYLLIVFCLHGLAAWIAAGSERTSYMGLQIALTFDLGVLQDYGLPTKIDPLRDRFIGIILGVCIISIVFSLVWPESAQAIAREKLAACLRTIARLLHLGGSNDGSQGSSPQREQLELEIASRPSEANSFEEQAAFEAMLCGSKAPDGPNLENAIAAVDEIYVACLPWLRVQTPSTDTIQAGGHPKDRQELSGSLARRTEKLAHRLEPEDFRAPGSTHFQTEAHERFESDASDHDESSDSRGLVTLVRALAQVETLLEATKKGG